MLRGILANLATGSGNSRDQGSHYFLLVVQPQPPRGFPVAQPVYWASTYTPAAGETRFDVQQELFRQLLAKRPHCRNATIINFTLERNELSLPLPPQQ